MVAWRNWDWQAIAIIVTIIGAAYLLGRDTVSPGEVRAIVTGAVGTAVAEAVAPLATRDEVRAIATDAVGAAVAEAIAPLATRDDINRLHDGQRAQSNCLSDLYAAIRGDWPSFTQDVPACERLAASGP